MFVKVCSVDAFAQTPSRRFTIDSHDVFIIQFEGRHFAYLNRCPHRHAALNWEEDTFFDSDQALLRCAMHGALFEPESGRCVSGPCLGDSLHAIPLEQRSNLLYIKLD